jgi:pimeloyl-ACP methyl ester carboxylesterase
MGDGRTADYDGEVRRKSWPPVPPFEAPPARTIAVEGVGELFLRDSGGSGPPVMLLHGWTVSADLNWWACYRDLQDAGYRVLAIDHRGHGRGLRTYDPFTLTACAADAAAAIRALGCAPATVVGYSMGGAIAQLLARDHPAALSGLVLSATAQHWQDPGLRRYWRTMGPLSLCLALAPRTTWRLGLRYVGLRESPQTAWVLAELIRHSAMDIAEAGRELGRFDSRAWLSDLEVPAAVVVTTNDQTVPPRKQRELAAALRAAVFEAPIDHIQITSRPDRYNPALLQAIASVREPARAMQDGSLHATADAVGYA